MFLLIFVSQVSSKRNNHQTIKPNSRQNRHHFNKHTSRALTLKASNLKPLKHPFNLPKLLQNSPLPLLPPNPKPRREIISTNQETLTIRLARIRTNPYLIPSLSINRGQNLKSPQQLRHRQEQIPLRQMNAGTQSPTRPVPVVVSC
jgi:hypothetical protein